MIKKLIHNHHQLHENKKKHSGCKTAEENFKSSVRRSSLDPDLRLLHKSWDESEGVSLLSQSSLESEACCLSAASERAALFMARCISQVARWMVRKAPPAAHIQFFLSQLWVFMLHTDKQAAFVRKNKNSQRNGESTDLDRSYGSIYWTAVELLLNWLLALGLISNVFDMIPNVDVLVLIQMPEQCFSF